MAPSSDDEVLVVLRHLSSEVSGSASELCVFSSVTAPEISICDYLTRLMSRVRLDDQRSVAMVALVYMRRARDAGCAINSLTRHRLLAACIWASVKYLLDQAYSCRTHSKLAGLSRHEVCLLEARLLQILGWRLHVSADQLLRLRVDANCDKNACSRFSCYVFAGIALFCVSFVAIDSRHN
jgi:hypothetical protein